MKSVQWPAACAAGPSLVLAMLAAGCSSASTNEGTADSGGDDAQAEAGPLNSFCGFPGDTGNSLGVGQFCETVYDCQQNSKATLCTQLGNPNTYFCTFRCDPDAGAGVCGENAICACSGQCGCVPTRCVHHRDGGTD